MSQDEEHLRLLSIFHYVVGCLAGLFALFPIIHLVIGIAFVLSPENMRGQEGQPPPEWLGWIFILFASVFITLGWVFAGFVLTAGRFLSKRKHYTFCLVMGGVDCIFMPFGTVLGVFTILVLMRESVRERFEKTSLPAPGPD